MSSNNDPITPESMLDDWLGKHCDFRENVRVAIWWARRSEYFMGKRKWERSWGHGETIEQLRANHPQLKPIGERNTYDCGEYIWKICFSGQDPNDAR